MNLYFGTLAIYFALQHKILLASVMILFSALCDFLDGLFARLLKAYSDLGKELDSLSDLVSFGLAPIILLTNVIGFKSIVYFVMLYPVSAAYRLARFNISKTSLQYFEGLPVPAAALSVLGLVLYLNQGENLSELFVITIIVLLSILMISKVKLLTLKFRTLTLKDIWHKLILLLAAVGLILFYGYLGLSLVILFYIFWSIFWFYIFKN